MTDGIGILEIHGLTPALCALDAAEKAASIRILQMELNDFGGVVLKWSAPAAPLRASVVAARTVCERMHAAFVWAMIDRPDPQTQKAIHSPREHSPLLDAPVVFFPSGETFAATSEENREMPEPQPYALGMIETQGFTAVLEAIDTACKAAHVEVVGKEKLGGGYITVLVRGEVSAVSAAIDAGKEKVGSLGKLIAAHIIPRPSDSVLALLPRI
ncbi:MAG: BMC domain-containing protein [Pirellulales bacterium]|nr:BMC domain-containing protein [Pirellulales bacterium]